VTELLFLFLNEEKNCSVRISNTAKIQGSTIHTPYEVI